MTTGRSERFVAGASGAVVGPVAPDGVSAN